MNDKKISRREFLKLGTWTLLGGSIFSLGGFSYASSIEPKWIEITQTELNLKRLPKSFDGFKITQISDIHLGSWMSPEHFANIIDLVNKTSPDIVVITGDFVSSRPEYYKTLLIQELSRLKPKEKTFAILGNHDHWTNAEVIREALSSSNIIELDNKIHILERNNEKLYICGVDDYWEKWDDLEKVSKELPSNVCAILLAHEPDFADISAATGQFDLQLSGHSHGGQVNIPLIGPPILPYFAEKYPSGQYQIKDMLLYTNRGVGMSKLAVRFNCRPEISVLTLKYSMGK